MRIFPHFYIQLYHQLNLSSRINIRTYLLCTLTSFFYFRYLLLPQQTFFICLHSSVGTRKKSSCHAFNHIVYVFLVNVFFVSSSASSFQIFHVERRERIYKYFRCVYFSIHKSTCLHFYLFFFSFLFLILYSWTIIFVDVRMQYLLSKVLATRQDFDMG